MLLSTELKAAQMTPQVRARSGLSAYYTAVSQGFRKAPVPPEQAKALFDAVCKLQDDYRALPRPPGRGFNEREPAFYELSRLRGEVAAALHPAPPPKPGPAQLERPPEWAAAQPEPPLTTGAVRFTPLSLEIKRLDGSREEVAAQVLGPRPWATPRLLPCGPGLDAYWNPGGIFLMRRGGLLEELLREHAHAIERVARSRL
jgi:hypothetical protein